MRMLARTRAQARSIDSMFKGFWRIDYIDEISYPASFLLGELATVVPVITTFFIGQLTVGSDNAQFFGSDYFTFAVLGLAIASILQGALTGFGFSLQRAQERGTLESFLVEPVSWTVLPIAMNVWRVALGLFNGFLVLVLGAMLGANYHLQGILAFLLLIFLGVLASQAIGVVAASLLVLAKRSTGVIRLYTLAASLLAGAVFSVEQLPPWLRAFSYAIPHTYVVTSAREQLMPNSGSFTIPFGTAVWVLIGFTIVVGGGGLLLFRRTLMFARKTGNLAGY